MIQVNEQFLLRLPEKEDIDSLYHFKNDRNISNNLGGFSLGYSIKDIEDWIEFHRNKKNQVVLVIEDKAKEKCIGHIGLYDIDYRIRKSEFAVVLGYKEYWGKGIGTICTKAIIDYSFKEMNLNKIELSVLEENKRAIALYRKIGFKDEGFLRQAQFKNGKYHNILLMGLLQAEYLLLED